MGRDPTSVGVVIRHTLTYVTLSVSRTDDIDKASRGPVCAAIAVSVVAHKIVSIAERGMQSFNCKERFSSNISSSGRELAQENRLDTQISGPSSSCLNSPSIAPNLPVPHHIADQPSDWEVSLAPETSLQFRIGIEPEPNLRTQRYTHTTSAEEESMRDLSECIQLQTFSPQPHQEALQVYYPFPASTLHGYGNADMLVGGEPFSLFCVTGGLTGDPSIAGWSHA